MPKYLKTPPNKPFDGVTATRYDNEYSKNKVTFTILGDTDLWICFCSARAPKRTAVDFFIDSFKRYAAFEVIQNINEFIAMSKVKASGEWGRHFEDGVLEIWHSLGLPFYAYRKL